VQIVCEPNTDSGAFTACSTSCCCPPPPHLCPSPRPLPTDIHIRGYAHTHRHMCWGPCCLQADCTSESTHIGSLPPAPNCRSVTRPAAPWFVCRRCCLLARRALMQSGETSATSFCQGGCTTACAAWLQQQQTQSCMGRHTGTCSSTVRETAAAVSCSSSCSCSSGSSSSGSCSGARGWCFARWKADHGCQA
jgi:hypothetical protein